jgi:hypothetical protein
MAVNIPTPEDYKRMQAQAEKVAVEKGVSELVRCFIDQLKVQASWTFKSDTITVKHQCATAAICAAFQTQLEAAGWGMEWEDHSHASGMEWTQFTVTPKKQKAPERLFH